MHGKIKRYTKKRKSLAEKTIWTYLLQLCSGLETLHKINIMHRDLKPKNIFLTAHNQIRLGDLGCAKIMKAGMARTQIGTSSSIPADTPRPFPACEWIMCALASRSANARCWAWDNSSRDFGGMGVF